MPVSWAVKWARATSVQRKPGQIGKKEKVETREYSQFGCYPQSQR